MQQGNCLCGAPLPIRPARCNQCGAAMCLECATLSATAAAVDKRGLGPECNPDLLNRPADAEKNIAPTRKM